MGQIGKMLIFDAGLHFGVLLIAYLLIASSLLMSESSHLANNTFLSRVFAATRSHQRDMQDMPLLSDDTLSFQRGSPSESNANLLETSPRTPKQHHQGSKLAINVHSESEDESSDDSATEQAADASINDNSAAKSPPSKGRLDSKSHTQTNKDRLDANKRRLLQQLETELGVDDNDYNDFVNFQDDDGNVDNVSRLLEEGRYEPGNNGLNRGDLLRRLEQSVTGIAGSDRRHDLSVSISHLGERAKTMANKVLQQIPPSLNIENSTFLQPPPGFVTNKQRSKAFLTATDDDSDDVRTEPPRNQQQNQQHGSVNATSFNQRIFNARKLPPKERAMWMWANVTNLDIFLQDVYDYYLGNGWYCIALQRFLNLTVVVFVIWLSTFMGNCIDYHKLTNGSSNKLSDVYIEHCYAKTSFIQKLFFTILGLILILRVKHTWEELCDFKEIHLFYKHLLDIKDDELQTISWPQIVKRIIFLKDQHTNAVVSLIEDNNVIDSKVTQDLKSKDRLNAHDIANRLMRKDNYMIAIFNKNILNRALTVPAFKTYFLTKTLEWNLKLCIIDFMFTKEGQLKQSVLSQNNRPKLANSLRKRFKLAGLLSIILTPFLVVYFVLYFFLKFFYDFKTNPGLLNSREYSPFAKWKMREFNELPHLFDERLKFSVEGADEYLEQFPKEMTNIIMKFLSFISGSLLTVLVLFTIFDHENFLNFELTEGRTVLFYISGLGAIFTICKNNISSTNYVFDPEASLKYVSKFTHYLPQSWDGRYHSIEVKQEFCQLYNLKLVLIGKEICSLILLPWMLYVSLPSASEKIIDFFRDFSVHVDGIGYVCSFAMFNLSQDHDKDKKSTRANGIGKTKSARYRFDKNLTNLERVHDESSADNHHRATVPNIDEEEEDEIANDEYFADNDDKMIKSYIHFLESYGGNKNNSTNDGEFKIPRLNQHATNLNRRPRIDNMKKSILKPNYHERMEDTNAGLLSNDTGRYMNDLQQSVILGDNIITGFSDASNSQSLNESGEGSTGGVIGLLNQIYRHKD